MRKIFTLIAVVAAGLIAFGGSAIADPTTTPYPAADTPDVTVDDQLVGPGATVQFSGTGYTPGETIAISATNGSGLRSNLSAGLRAAGAPATALNFTVVGDAAGNFSTPVTLPAVGMWTLTATGLTSGIVLSLNVEVVASGTDGTTTPAATGGVADGGTDDGDLAYTGASIFGPLAIGAAALVLGLTLLFFGTRMAIRRKHHVA